MIAAACFHKLSKGLKVMQISIICRAGYLTYHHDFTEEVSDRKVKWSLAKVTHQ